MSTDNDIADIFPETGGFDTNSVPASSGDFEAIPAGWYAAQIDAAEVRDTKARDGKYLHLELTIVGDKFNGRKLFPNINLANPNAKAVEIGTRELAGLGQACGLARVKDSAELLGHVVMVKIKVKQDPGRDPENQVVAYKTAGEAGVPPVQEPAPAAPAARPAAVAAPKPTPAPAAAPAAAAKPKRPWER